MKKVSFVIPCYRSEHTLPHVVKEIREKMQELTQYEYDIFLVNDASPDNTMGTIRDLCDKYDNIKGIGFARNFGQHAALMAGFHQVKGVWMMTDRHRRMKWTSCWASWKRVSMPFTPATNINSIPHSGIWEARSMS